MLLFSKRKLFTLHRIKPIIALLTKNELYEKELAYMSLRNVLLDDKIAAAYGVNEGIVYAALSACNDAEATFCDITSSLDWVLNQNQVRHALRKMEKGGVVLSYRKDESDFDRTKTYRAVRANG